MKSSILLPLCTAVLAAAVHPPQIVLGDSQAPIAETEKFLIELAPGETQWVTEDDKWALRRVSRVSFCLQLLTRALLPGSLS
jgi:leucyl aminopeptidase